MLFGKSSTVENSPRRTIVLWKHGTFKRKVWESPTYNFHTYERIDKIKQSKWFKCNQVKRILMIVLKESRYYALFLVSGSIKKIFSINCVSIYLFSIFFSIDLSVDCVNIYLFSIDFDRWKSEGLHHIASIVIH